MYSQYFECFVVQSVESGRFLYPSDTGDVGHCDLITDAGIFDDEQSAVDCALEEIGENFVVFRFFKKVL
ncbi:hypothetical protein J2T38_002304 [Neisseria perflava]|uniref:hypothetical protein n=1 Tax=Neisseria perflava TaxID=33053 RepID=UPI0020A06EAC|nr:hypothetical protein [Neisseria perflava]MCP1773450.1 hypothetical protein [Neisseria perflava]